MTMINVGGEATGGTLTANATALGADQNLVFTMKSIGTANTFSYGIDAIPCVNRPFRLNKNDVLQKAKLALTHLPTTTTTDVNGVVKVMRDTSEVAALPFKVPASGQMLAPAVTTSLAINAASAISRDVTKVKRLAAAYRDAAGLTPIGAASQIWMGLGSSTFGVRYEIDVGGTDIGGSVGKNLVLVPYDKLADKEGTPFTVPLSWSLGPYSASVYPTSTIGASGNIPEGTVVQLLEIGEFENGAMIAASAVQSVTIGPSGAIGIWAGYSSTDIFSPDGKTKVRMGRATLVKLSTHSTWTKIVGNGNSIPIANVFSAGGIATPPATVTFSGAATAEIFVNFGNAAMQGAGFNTRFEFKGFIDGRQVFGTGSNRTGNAVGTWNGWAGTGGSGQGIRCVFNSAGTSLDYATFSIGSAYNNLHLDYDSKDPRGDQYFVNGEKVNVVVAVPPKPTATGVVIYAQNLITTTNGSTTTQDPQFAPWALVYDGPMVSSFNWDGSAITTPATPPNTNTTANYPATTKGSVSWDVADPSFIDVLPGDSVICQFTNSVTVPAAMIGQVTIPVEFLD